jgi:glycosyltransferase involved in cell wall biosynthesis
MKENKNARLVKVKPGGISPAFNKGVVSSKGNYLMFLNSDDYFYDKEVLRRAHEILKRRKLDWVYGVINVVEEDGRGVGKFPKFGLFKKRRINLLKYVNYIPHQSVFINKSVFGEFGLFDEDLSSQMDYEYWLRIARKTKWKFIELVVSNYTIRSGAQSSSKKNIAENHENMRFVQGRYSNKVELFFAGIVEIFVNIYNKTYR